MVAGTNQNIFRNMMTPRCSSHLIVTQLTKGAYRTPQSFNIVKILNFAN